MGSSSITMTLGGVSLGANFPSYSRTFEYIRGDDQGAGIKKVKVTLSGFLEGTSNSVVMSLYQSLKNTVGVNDTTFTYISDGVTIHSSQKCWIESYSEPGDEEFCKVGVGDYGISIYWFEDASETNGVSCTYTNSNGVYTFSKTPRWGRQISANRPTHRASNAIGSTATIALEGTLYASSHANLATAISNLQAAFLLDGLLTYGSFAHNVRVVDVNVSPVTLQNYANYSVTLKYDIGSIVELSSKIKVQRVHSNPIITEQPFCGTRTIEFMNASSQTITYSISISAADVATARSLLATEAANTVISGGVEMPGGEEEWNEDNKSVSVTIIKLYPNPVIPNLAGTNL